MVQVRSMNQGKLDMLKQEMARVNIDSFKNQWTEVEGNGWNWYRWPVYLLLLGKNPLEEIALIVALIVKKNKSLKYSTWVEFQK